MQRFGILYSSVLFLAAVVMAADSVDEKAEFDSSLRSFMQSRAAEFDQIPVERKAELKTIAEYAKSCAKDREPIRLTFVCTHNSRRSQMCQVWAAAAARFYGVRGVETFSGGTEATAFNPRAISALQRAGIHAEKIDDGKNPRYGIRFKDADKPAIYFSKVYHDAPNPKKDFCAVMTCSQADKSCPNVVGSSLRVAIPFEDPKVSDDKTEEKATYDERCQQICREMMYLFSQIEK